MSTSAFRGWLHPISLDAELMSILPEAVEDMELDWVAPEQPSKRWMDGSFLGGAAKRAYHRDPPLSSLSSTKSSLVQSAKHRFSVTEVRSVPCVSCVLM